MAKNEANVNEATVEAKVSLKDRMKNAYGKAVTFVALNRGKIGFGFGLVIGAAGAVAATNVIENRRSGSELIEAEFEECDSAGEFETIEE